jgi:sigma-B regulation protein RsbU (phosphoserine phosphatase)
MNPIPLLIVEDNPIYAEVLQNLLDALGTGLRFRVTWVDTAEKATAAIAERRFDIVLLDYKLPGADGLSVLADIRTLPAEDQPAVIMLTGMGREEVAVEAMKRGAKDYLSKDHLDVPSLLRAITTALERRALESQVASYTEELRERNAQLQTDLAMAREIQEAFLPQTYPTFPAGVALEQSALRFTHKYMPTTTIGGDFFDVLPLRGNRAGVFISDVMGHGVRAALVTAILRALASDVAAVTADPGQFLTELNSRLLQILRQSKSPMFASAFYLIADPGAGTLEYATAGHPTPLLVSRSTATVRPLPLPKDQAGPALGVFPDSRYQFQRATLAANDLIVLYTDGVFEVLGANNELYGEDRLCAALRDRAHMQTPQLFDELIDAIKRFSTRPEFTDDVCLLGMDCVRVGGAR